MRSPMPFSSESFENTNRKETQWRSTTQVIIITRTKKLNLIPGPSERLSQQGFFAAKKEDRTVMAGFSTERDPGDGKGERDSREEN